MVLYPINLNISGRRCVVIGGGAVAFRKVKTLLKCAASVAVVSPELCSGLADYAATGQISWLKRGYEPGDVQGAFLCFAATNNKTVQQAIEQEAKQGNVLVNIIDNPVGSDFHVPSQMKQGELLFTVSTGGSSPALSKKIRRELEQQYGSEYGDLLCILKSVRRSVVSRGQDHVVNKELFDMILESDILCHIQQENWPEVERLLTPIVSDRADVENAVEELRKKGKQAR